MLTAITKQLEAAKSKVAELEAAYMEQKKSLSSLPAEYGFKNVNEFIAA